MSNQSHSFKVSVSTNETTTDQTYVDLEKLKTQRILILFRVGHRFYSVSKSQPWSKKAIIQKDLQMAGIFTTKSCPKSPSPSMYHKSLTLSILKYSEKFRDQLFFYAVTNWILEYFNISAVKTPSELFQNS